MKKKKVDRKKSFLMRIFSHLQKILFPVKITISHSMTILCEILKFLLFDEKKEKRNFSYMT